LPTANAFGGIAVVAFAARMGNVLGSDSGPGRAHRGENPRWRAAPSRHPGRCGASAIQYGRGDVYKSAVRIRALATAVDACMPRRQAAPEPPRTSLQDAIRPGGHPAKGATNAAKTGVTR